LHSRSVTTGIHEFEFTPQGTDSIVHFIDVGGQASERRKWINQFDNVNAILFFSALDSYCLAATPPHTWRIDEELAVWASLQQQISSNVSFIFLQNKSDIFAQIIKTHPLSKYFPDMPEAEGSDHDACVKYLRNRFLAKWRGTGNLNFHLTNSLDKGLIKKIWDEVRQDILLRVLSQTGFAIGSI